MKATAITVSAVTFPAITIACIATALLAMISTEIRACNHDKGKDNDGQENDTDYIHLENPICKQGYHIGNGTLTKDNSYCILLSYLPADRSYCCHARGVEKTEHKQ